MTENVPASQEAPKSPAPAAEPKPAAKKKRKKGGFLRGCLISLLALLFVAAVIATFFFRLPHKLGLVKSAGAQFTEATPERLAAKEIVAEAEAKGFLSKGVSVYVFPEPESGNAVVYALYDFSKEAALTKTTSYQPVVGALVLLGGGAKAKEYGISYAAVDVQDEDGKHIFTVAAKASDIADLMDNKISEQQFTDKLGKRVDLPNYLRRVAVPF